MLNFSLNLNKYFIISYFFITSIFFVIFIDKMLLKRGYELTYRGKINIFIIMSISICVLIVLCNDILKIFRLAYFLPFTIIISIIDINEKNVYDEDLINAIILEMAIILLNDFSDLEYWISIFGGAATLFVVAYLISHFTKSMGMGDVLYFALVGGFVDIQKAILIFFISFFVASICCIPRLIVKGYGDGMVPFTPFISISAIIIIAI